MFDLSRAPGSRGLNPVVCGANDIPGGVFAGTKRIEKQKMRPGEFIVKRRMILNFAPPANGNSPSVATQPPARA